MKLTSTESGYLMATFVFLCFAEFVKFPAIESMGFFVTFLKKTSCIQKMNTAGIWGVVKKKTEEE